MTQPSDNEPNGNNEGSDEDRFYEDNLVETPDSLRNANPENPELDLGQDPKDSYLASDRWGVTAEEERLGEPLDLRLSEEEPDVGQPGYRRALGEDEPGERLVSMDGTAFPDTEKDEVGESVGADDGDLSAEEAAIHIVDEP